MDERLLKADAVVFDVGNVLLTFEVEKVAALLPEGARDKLIPVLFGDRHLWGKFDLGMPDNEAIAREAAREAGLDDRWQLPLSLLDRFPDTMTPLPLYGLIPHLQALGKRLFALTNYPEPSFSLTCDRFPHLKSLDGALVSAREKLKKPDAAFFRLLINRYGIIPERTLFIDDLLPNVQTARELGFQAWHYAGSDRL